MAAGRGGDFMQIAETSSTVGLFLMPASTFYDGATASKTRRRICGAAYAIDQKIDPMTKSLFPAVRMQRARFETLRK